MTKPEALYKLLALGGLTSTEAVAICGWPRAVFDETLAYLMDTRLVTYTNLGGRGQRVYQVA
jgi:hypothetical protein